MKRYPSHWSSRAMLITIGIMTGSLLAMPAFADGNHGHVQADGRFTPNVNGAAFPPQPRSVENVRQFTPQPNVAGQVVRKGTTTGTGNQSVTTKAVGTVRDAATAAASANTEVRNQLGARYAHVKTASVKDKWGGNGDRYDIVFFSHSNNQTVKISYEGGDLDDLEIIPANLSQPPLAESEMTEAIELARSHWIGISNSQIAQLTGYAIQTFRDDGSPHLTRVVYVSFHVESPESPALMTWVDLTNQQVVRAEQAQ